jgi:hypothetical protein
MNPTTLQPVIHQAQRRLAQVAQLADEANIALPDHHLGRKQRSYDHYACRGWMEGADCVRGHGQRMARDILLHAIF